MSNDDIRLETVIIRTTRLRAMADFYEKGLGIGPFMPLGDDHLGVHLGSVYLGFDRVDVVDGAPPSAVSFWLTVPDVEAALARLAGRGARVHSPPARAPWGQVLASVYDPDGNLLGLAGHVDEAQP